MSVLGFQVRPAIFLVEADAGRREEPPRYESWLSRSWQQSTVPQALWATLSHGLSLPHQASPAPARRPRKTLIHQGWRRKRRPRRCRGSDWRLWSAHRVARGCGRPPRSMAIYPSFLRGKTPNFGGLVRDAAGALSAEWQVVQESGGAGGPLRTLGRACGSRAGGSRRRSRRLSLPPGRGSRRRSSAARCSRARSSC